LVHILVATSYGGRGYPHLTHKKNYEKFGVADNPAHAANPEFSAYVIGDGMVNGKFSKDQTVEAHIPRNGTADFVNARKIINGLDRAKPVAGYAEHYLNALNNCGFGRGQNH
jgi:putative chitinase